MDVSVTVFFVMLQTNGALAQNSIDNAQRHFNREKH